MNDITPELQRPQNPRETQENSTGLLVISLYVLAAFCATAGLVVGIWRALQEPVADQSPALSVMAGLTTLVGGFVAAGLLWATAWLVRHREASLLEQRQLLRAVRAFREAGAPQPVETATPPAEDIAPLLRSIREEIAELNVNTLLTAEQREAKRLRKQSQRAGQLSRQVALAIRESNFDQAEEFLERLSHEIPDDPHLDELRDRIDEGRRDEVRRIVQQQVRRTSDLMAVARFEEAVEVAREVEQTHGGHPEADGLLQRVMREAETYELEQRRRLFSRINAHGEARQWKLALEAAHRLLETYPDSSQADQVRGMMPTIVDNARIEEVRGLRDRILDLMERRRYEEAVSLAKHVVNNYPETAAADELRQKMPRLEELAFRQRNENGQG
jgi:tetratricopeptide (TPR) repeat protein